MRTAVISSLSRQALGVSSWERFEKTKVSHGNGGSSRRARPLLAACLMAAGGTLLVGGCLVAARLGGSPGIAAALIGFVAYLVVFARGLSQLPVEWSSLRERDYHEYHEGADDRSDEVEGGRP